MPEATSHGTMLHSKTTLTGRVRSKYMLSAASRGARIAIYKASTDPMASTSGSRRSNDTLRGTAALRQRFKPNAAPGALNGATIAPPAMEVPLPVHHRSKTMNMKGIQLQHRQAQEARAQRLAARPDEAEAMNFLSEALGTTPDGNEDYDIQMDDTGKDTEHEEDWADDEDALPAVESAWRQCQARQSHPRYAAGRGVYAQRLATHATRWASEIPALAQAFLRWQHGKVDLPPVPHNTGPTTSLHIVKWDGIEKLTIVCHANGDNLLERIIEQGYMPCSPDVPRLAIALPILQVLHHCRLRAFISHEAFARVLCDLHGRPYRRRLRLQMSDAYDAWVAMLLHVDELIKEAFGHTSPNWRLLNSCAACEYRLRDEPTLPHSKLVSCDGNNSSKRFAHAGHQDHRVFSSDYLISEEEVDEFAREVAGRHLKSANTEPCNDNDIHEALAQCTDRWKTTRATDNATHWMDGMRETGNFLFSCRHGMILFSADMVRSGELAKYPLAGVHRLLQVYGDSIALGYDIGCDFSGTVARSRIGPVASALKLHFYVGAFHGYAHNRKCQLGYHPRIQSTAGLEDFETNEWIFSRQNGTAHLFRYGSRFHRHMTLHLFWERWDLDRRAVLADFLYNNYKQALDILDNVGPTLRLYQAREQITDEQFAVFIAEERQYFEALRAEPDEDRVQYEYFDTLKELEAHRQKLEGFHTFVNITPETWNTLPARTRERQLQREHLAVLRAQERLEMLAVRYEQCLDTERWTPDSLEWKHIEQRAMHRQYNQALDHLESLVVQRLFELEKLNLRGTGYAMRKAMAKAMDERCGAIRTALQRYNEHARHVTPPRPTLTYDTIISMTWVSEFALLRYSRQDLKNERWADKLVREMTVQWLRLQCAKEELRRLNVEVRRLWTSLHDEPIAWQQSITAAQQSGYTLLAAAMEQRFTERQRVNYALQQRIQQIFALPGFSGHPTVGIRDAVGIQSNEQRPMAQNPAAVDEDPLQDEPDLAREDTLDDDAVDELDRVQLAFEQLSLP